MPRLWGMQSDRMQQGRRRLLPGRSTGTRPEQHRHVGGPDRQQQAAQQPSAGAQPGTPRHSSAEGGPQPDHGGGHRDRDDRRADDQRDRFDVPAVWRQGLAGGQVDQVGRRPHDARRLEDADRDQGQPFAVQQARGDQAKSDGRDQRRGDWYVQQPEPGLQPARPGHVVHDPVGQPQERRHRCGGHIQPRQGARPGASCPRDHDATQANCAEFSPSHCRPAWVPAVQTAQLWPPASTKATVSTVGARTLGANCCTES